MNRDRFGDNRYGRLNTNLSIENWNYEKMNVLVKGSKVPVVTELWMPGCVPCVAVSAKLEELAKEYEGEAVFGKIRADEYKGPCEIGSVPVTIITTNGAIFSSYNGIFSVDKFIDDLNRAIEEMEQ